MSDHLLTAVELSTQKPWYNTKRGRAWQPFDALDDVPLHLKELTWCRHCQMDVDSEIDQGTYEGTAVYRKRCLRCGRTIHFGIAKAEIMDTTRFSPAAFRFVSQFGHDRR